MNDVIDEGQESGSPSDTGQSGASPAPYDQDPKWKSARAAEKQLTELMETTGFEDVESLAEHLKTTKDIDLAEIMEDSQTLKQYKEYWAANEESKLRQEETPEQTIKRLEERNVKIDNERMSEKESQSEIVNAEKALNNYNKTVTSIVSSNDSIPEAQREFLNMFLGVDNPANEVDIDDPKAVKAMAQQGVKKYQSFVESILKDYRDGKLKIPKVAGTVDGEAVVEPEKKIKSIKDARKASMEILKSKLFQRS